MATTFDMGGHSALPTAAELLDGLSRCLSSVQLRQWLSTTFTARTRLPEALLAQVERARQDREAFVAEERRKRIVAARVAAIAEERVKRHAYRHRGTRGHRPPLLAEAQAAMTMHGLSAATFGRAAVNDPCLILELEAGRQPRAKTQARVRAYIAALAAQAEEA